jgi:hypothetical protein
MLFELNKLEHLKLVIFPNPKSKLLQFVRLHVLLANIRLGRKYSQVSNVPAYC